METINIEHKAKTLGVALRGNHVFLVAWLISKWFRV